MTGVLPTALILASGRGERFLASGGQAHKLKALLGGKAVLQHVIDAAIASGLPYHVEDVGHPGMGDSIAAAVQATPDANGWLILPGDLPLIKATTLLLLANQLTQQEVVIPVYSGTRGHPVGFSRAFGNELMALRGSNGAASLLRGRQVNEIIVDDIGVVTDVDTLEDLARAEVLLKAQ